VSEWRVSLAFVEGGSKKFWRARVEGGSLFVSYGRIGTGGQTQVKEFPSEAAAEKELEKLEREKRKKGYEDEGAAPVAAEEPEETEDSAEALPETDAARFILESEGRRIELELSREGLAVRTVVLERYDSAKTASDAFARIAESLLAEGYKKV
jgi:predicted DNA-binding WGR domain protein